MKTGMLFSLVALAGLAACAEDTTAPLNIEAGALSPQVAVNLTVASGGSLDFSADLENLRLAVLPSFGDPAAADSLGARLISLQEQLAAGDRTAATETLAKARAGIAPDVSDPTTLGYVEMVFTSIDVALARN